MRAQGIVKANHATNIYAQTAGQLDALLVRHGERVQTGQVLARFSNLDLASELRITESAQLETQAQIRQALHKAEQDLFALQDKAAAIGEQLGDLNLSELGAEITAVRRGKIRLPFAPDTLLEAGDVVVLRGNVEALELAEKRLLLH